MPPVHADVPHPSPPRQRFPAERGASSCCIPMEKGSGAPRVQIPSLIPVWDHWDAGITPCPARQRWRRCCTSSKQLPFTCRDGWEGGRRQLKEKEAGAGKSGLFPAAVSLLTLDNPVPQFTRRSSPACSGDGGHWPPPPGQRGAKSPPNPGAAGKGTESLSRFPLQGRTNAVGCFPRLGEGTGEPATLLIPFLCSGPIQGCPQQGLAPGCLLP